MSERKHKGGYELLKEKYAKLEKERDERKAKYEKVEQEAKGLRSDNLIWRKMLKKEHDVVEFFLHYSPFWVRWMYRKRFEKGGN